ncbi:MAG: 2-amino-4-hydroxy-6-hydroxymethyldihydropteridine diphosphokinase [Bacteriovoracaceae bacterium]|nr:2-amino-4-hydroxy-6-hydroxymethyldihydropteridine diphosphokinase [Bacteriovoracaceae bacterium]
MSLILSTGTNLGNRLENLVNAKEELCKHFSLLEESNVYESPAVDYTLQPDFLNQVLEFKIPEENPYEVLYIINSIENDFGRSRVIDKGPRTLDIDILFWKTEIIDNDKLTIPHPRLFNRSFIVLPLKELSGFTNLSEKFEFPKTFDNTCWLFQKV